MGWLVEERGKVVVGVRWEEGEGRSGLGARGSRLAVCGFGLQESRAGGVPSETRAPARTTQTTRVSPTAILPPEQHSRRFSHMQNLLTRITHFTSRRVPRLFLPLLPASSSARPPF